jgi:hypothetical protein
MESIIRLEQELNATPPTSKYTRWVRRKIMREIVLRSREYNFESPYSEVLHSDSDED